MPISLSEREEMSDNYQQANAKEKKVLPPLDKDQVEYAHEQLEELHPLE